MRTTAPLAAMLCALLVGTAPVLVLGQSDAESAGQTGTWFDGLEAGICIDDVFDAAGEFDFSEPALIVPCDGPHDDEVVARLPIDADVYPDEGLDALSSEMCAPEYEAFVGRPLDTTLLGEFSVWPGSEDWDAGARDVLCIVYANEPVKGTAASSNLRLPGTTIATVAELMETREVLTIDGGSGKFRYLLHDVESSELLSQPAWSPDGTSIAFAAEAGEGAAKIYRADVETGETSLLVDRGGTNDSMSISPDGTTLAYISDEETDEFEIYSLDIATGVSTRLTDWADRDTSPQWSPDGSSIAFRRRTHGVSDIWVMAADGSDPVRLTDNGANNYDPRWSPDGSRLLYTSDAAGNFDIWMMAADGSDAQAITTHPGDDEYPAWSNDGSIIAFHSDRHGGVSLWLMRADGSEQSELTGIAPIGYPAFSPAD